MTPRCGVAMTTIEGDLWCDRERGHAGAHSASSIDEGRSYVWHDPEAAAATVPAVTLDELLEHQGDLAEHAAAEGFHTYAAAIEQLRLRVMACRRDFERRTPAKLPPSPFCPS